MKLSLRSICSTLLIVPAMLFTAAVAPAADKAPKLSSGDVKALVANAKTPADHLKLAAHYNAMAAQHEADAVEHEALAAEYTRAGKTAKTPMTGNTAEHCKHFAEHCRQAAKDLREMATVHEQMAKAAK